MALLDRVKERIETDLSDAELQAMIDAVTTELDARFGANGQVTQVKEGDQDLPTQGKLLTLWRPLDEDQPVTVKEIERDGSETTLQADDFKVLHGGRTLLRLDTGTNPRSEWPRTVSLTFTPHGDSMRREEVIINVVQLDITYRGLDKQERAGDYSRAGSVTSDAYTREREALILALAPRQGLQVA